MPTTPLLPLPDGLEITAISALEQELHVRVTSNRISSLCPLCSTPSFAIHSYYRRKPLELPCAGQTLRLLLSVKKFFCRVASCPRKVFTERLPELIEPSSRLTTRLRNIVQAICTAFNANGGVRLAEQLGIHLSRMTFLHSLLLVPTPPVGNVKAVGVDDFAWKRGKRYGTVIIDLETHRVLDLLPDREAESVKQWLVAHPEIEIVSRDRGGAYADGAARGAPQAIQIADRWHVCKNLGDAVEEYITRQKIQIPPLSPQEPVSQEASISPPLPPSVLSHHASQEKREHKQHLVDQVKTLYAEGNSIHAIAAELSLARNTVRRYLRLEEPTQPKRRPRKSSLLDPYYDYLCQRFKEGCSNASQLFQELREKGYCGGKITVRNFVARLRQGLPGVPRPPKHAKQTEQAVALSPRELRWLLSKREEELTSEEKDDLTRLLETFEEVKHLYHLLHSFLHMLRTRQPERLNEWLKEARTCGIKELSSFVAGVERDYDAVQAGLTFQWSQGPVEGTVNKIKTHKRLMYGRASFTLLRQKVLHLT